MESSAHRRDRILFRSKHHIEELSVRQPLCFVGQEQLAACHTPILDEQRELVLEYVGVIPHDDDMEGIIIVATCGFGALVIAFYHTDQATVCLSPGLCCKGDHGGRSTSNGTARTSLEVVSAFATEAMSTCLEVLTKMDVSINASGHYVSPSAHVHLAEHFENKAYIENVLGIDDFCRADFLFGERSDERGNPAILDSYIANATEEKELAASYGNNYAPVLT